MYTESDEKKYILFAEVSSLCGVTDNLHNSTISGKSSMDVERGVIGDASYLWPCYPILL